MRIAENMIKNPIALSMDLGKGFVKFTTIPINGTDEGQPQILSKKFPSFAPAARGGRMSLLNVETVKVNGHNYWVGPDALLTSTGKAKHIRTDSFYYSNEYLALYRGALAYMDLPENIDTIDMMGFGLPLHIWGNDRLLDNLLSTIKGTHIVPKLGGKGEREITVKGAELVPQVVGSLFAMSREVNISAAVTTRINLVIDVGYTRLRWLVTQGLKPYMNRSGANPGGVSTILAACIERFNYKLKGNREIVSRLDDAIRQGTKDPIHDAQIDLAPYMDQDQEVARNLRGMINKIGCTADINNIFLVGGGRHFYQKSLQNIFPSRKIHVTAGDPQFSNLTGIQLQAEVKLGLREREW